MRKITLVSFPAQITDHIISYHIISHHRSKWHQNLLFARGSRLLSNWCRQLSVRWSPASTTTTWVLVTSYGNMHSSGTLTAPLADTKPRRSSIHSAHQHWHHTQGWPGWDDVTKPCRSSIHSTHQH